MTIAVMPRVVVTHEEVSISSLGNQSYLSLMTLLVHFWAMLGVTGYQQSFYMSTDARQSLTAERKGHLRNAVFS